ncbi:MAG: BREX-1 system adenine-specific DNA-methyltransferase PglX [Planctomycetia bacterium]|nr:BREX-1 system adenine-specific DNA-methyltransferase PglX [Planctomycetia bacterium]
MDKNAIKKYAVWARKEWIARVCQKALLYGITAEDCGDVSAENVHGTLLTETERKQRKALIDRIKAQGYEQVMEEVAYTWFNRFSALRFMEVNGYLPSHVRVFTDEENNFKPQIIAEAIHLEMDGLDMEKVYDLKEANKTDELYKYLLITQCNALNTILPGMFQKIEDYTELLLPDNLLREDSVIQQMIELIPEDDWKDAVQIIGWLYQYYNSEKKDDVFAALKKNVKITKENIPAATQLFTPDWIVRYMVENSLGRLWLEGHPNDSLKSEWKYYLDEAEQEPDVQKQLDEIRKEYASLKPEDIKCIDPCMGSGHILSYLFDTLMKIYAAYGYSTRESVQSIIEHNLYGLDIDDRAAQLAYFAVMMKARQYDRRIFSRGIQPHIYAIVESNRLDGATVEYFTNNDPKLEKDFGTLVEELRDAKEYGSILNISPVDFAALYARVDEVREDTSIFREIVLNSILPLIQVAEVMAKKYDVVVTNPPYMGSSGMNAKLSDFVKKHYPDSKSDLFAVFMEHCGQMTVANRYQAMVTQHAWMFLSSYEKLRAKLLQKDTVNMAHLGARAFEEIGGEVVQTTSFVIKNGRINGYKGVYCRLVEPITQQGKEDMFLAGENRFESPQDNFSKIPGAPIAYWVSIPMVNTFSLGTVQTYGTTRKGMFTGNNDIWLKYWFEISREKFLHDFKPYNKGGSYRKWYGNNEYVVNWGENGFGIKEYSGSGNINDTFYFKKCVTWSLITTGKTSFRYIDDEYHVMGDAGPTAMFDSEEKSLYALAELNSCVIKAASYIINPTINLSSGVGANLPLLFIDRVKPHVISLSRGNVALSRLDWDSFETSWDFQRHPLVKWNKDLCDVTADHIYGDHSKARCPLERCFMLWQAECDERFKQLKANEEELNRIFIDIYGLQDELTPEVEDKDVTVRRADLDRDIRSLISYAVGCMFGRYSLDVDGLAYAGGEWEASKYRTFPADKDNIIPICDDEYFEDDIVGRLVEFVKVVYGEESLEANLQFIADTLGGKGSSREIIRNYFLNDFFGDHCKTYQKRPIYWLFDSGKKNGFKALMYMHRYQPDTIARIRTDYVHEQQSRYRTAITDLENRIADATTAERVRLNRQLSKLRDQSDEIRKYEEKIHHLANQFIAIDLDDGVKKNYDLFKDVLAKIK